MSKKLSAAVQNLLLALGSFLLTIVLIEGGATFFLKDAPKVPPREFPLETDIWNFDDVRRFSKEKGRIADTARFILSRNYEEKLTSKPLTAEESALREEAPSYPLSRNGKQLWLHAGAVTPDLNEEFQLVGSESGQIKYSVRYTTDKFGRRKAWDTGDKNILFLGCSFTFGQGVENEQTFPYLVGQKLGVRTYNAGIPGSSPSIILKSLRDKTIPGEISGRETTVILTIIPEHLERITASIAYFRENSHTFHTHPYAYLEDGKIVLKDNFPDDTSFKKKLPFYLSRLNFPKALGIEFPVSHEESYLLMAEILKEIERELRKNYPQIKNFMVSFFPTGNARVINRTLRDVFIKEKLNVLDFTFLNGPTLFEEDFYLKYDGHPSPITYELYSDLLIHELKRL